MPPFFSHNSEQFLSLIDPLVKSEHIALKAGTKTPGADELLRQDRQKELDEENSKSTHDFDIYGDMPIKTNEMICLKVNISYGSVKPQYG